MEKLRRQTLENEGPENFDDLLMELFTPEFLENLPPEQIEAVINKLKLVESSHVTIPPEWPALGNVLRKRGYLE